MAPEHAQHEKTESRHGILTPEKLLDIIQRAHELFLTEAETAPVFSFLLDSLVSLTESKYGFLDEVLRDKDGMAYKLSLALSNISWDENSRCLYSDLTARKLEFRNLNNLAGAPVRSGACVIANDAPHDPRSGGLPPGHPPLASFMGLPLCFGGELVGVAGVANRPGGYDEALAGRLAPFLSTCAAMIHATRQRERERQHLRQIEESGQMMAAILGATPESSFLIDVTGVVLAGNETFARRLGFEVSELIGQTIYSLLPAEIAETRRAWVSQVAAQKRPLRFEDVKNGRTFTHHLFPITGRDGAVERVAIFGADITESRRAEEVLRHGEEKYRRLIETTQEGVWSLDRDFRTTYVNPRMAQMLGYEPEEILGRLASDFMPPDEQEDHRRKLARRTEGRHSLYERTFICRDGRPLTCLVSATAQLDMRDGFEGSIAFLTDITARREAERRIKVFAEIIDSAPDSITIHSEEGRFLYANRETFALHGYTPEEFFAINLHDLDVPESEQLIHERIRMILENGSATFEVGHYRKDGSVLPLELSVKMIEWEGQTAFLSVGRDVSERHQAEEQQRANHELLDNLARLVPGVIYQYRLYPDGRSCFPWASPGMNMIYEMTPGDVRMDATPVFGRIHPEDAARVSEKIYASARTLETFYCEFRVILPKQGLRWRWSQAHPQRTEDGGTLWHGIISDITERKEAEEEIRSNEARLRSLVSIQQHQATSTRELLDFALEESIRLTASKIGYIYLYDENTQEFSLNTWSRDVMAECRIVEPKTLYNLEKTGIWGEAVRQRRPIVVNDFHAPHPMKKGYPEGHAPLYSFMTLPILHEGHIVAVVGVANKTTAYTESDTLQLALLMDSVWKILLRKRAEEELRQRESLLQQIFDILPVGLWFADKDGNLIRGNPAGVKIWGAEPKVGIEEYGVFKARRLPSREELGTDNWALARTMREGVTIINERLEIDAFDGQKRVILNSTAPVKDADGVVQGAIVVNQDITDQHRLESQLQQAMKMEAVGRLAGGVAHDFNNLLTGITGNAQLALLDLLPGDPLEELLTEISRSADSAAALTRQLLAFSRKQLVEPKILNMNDLIATLHKMLVRLIGEDIVLKTIPGHDLGSVRIDPGQFEQMVVNLTVNARDAMPDGGTVLIETANVELDETYCRNHPDAVAGAYVMLAVSDTGCGMTEEVKSHIFEPFFTTKPKGRGTGLGLPTIFGAVKQAGGLVDVYSEVNEGTTFKIYLPRVAEKAEKLVKANRLVAMPGGSETVLLVEDEPGVRDLATRVLKRLGYTVLDAADGGTATTLAQHYPERIDLLLTDVVMPGINGRQLAERLRAIQPGMKVLYTSGYTEDAIAHHGVIDAGLEFIPKPYTPQDLARKVRRVLESR